MFGRFTIVVLFLGDYWSLAAVMNIPAFPVSRALSSPFKDLAEDVLLIESFLPNFFVVVYAPSLILVDMGIGEMGCTIPPRIYIMAASLSSALTKFNLFKRFFW